MRDRILLALILMAVTATMAAAAEQASVALTAIGSMERIGQSDKPFGQPEARIQAARNEWESFQVVVAAPMESITVTAANMAELVGPQGARIGGDDVRLFREEYVRVRCSTPRAELPPGLYADPLVPLLDPTTGKPIEPRRQHQERWGEPMKTVGYDMYAIPFEVFRGQNQPIWVDVHVPKTAPAGQYRGVFRVSTRTGAKAELPVTLTVWDFNLPDAPTHRNHFGEFRGVARLFGVQPNSERFRQIEARYCRAMAEHRLCPPVPGHLLPAVNPKDGSLTIDPERHKQLAKFIAENHVADIQISCPFGRLPHSTLDPNYKTIAPAERAKARRFYADYYQYLEKNGWADRAYVYLLDEPNTRENYEQVLVLGALVKEAAPKLKRLVVEQTYPQAPDWPDIDPAVDIWCPLWAFIDRDTIAQKIAHGDEVFSYTALVQPAPPYHPRYKEVKGLNPPYWHIDRPLTVYRVPTWINRQYGITGLLYWSTVTQVMDPWNNPAFAHPRHYNGGGYLFYPGVPCGIDGPVASIRLKVLRDGMEDYEYFAILEKRAGNAAVKQIVDTIAPNWWDFAKEPARFQAAREELAKKIMAAKR